MSKVILNPEVSHIQIARLNGGITIKGQRYIYLPDKHARITRDALIDYRRATRRGIGWAAWVLDNDVSRTKVRT